MRDSIVQVRDRVEAARQAAGREDRVVLELAVKTQSVATQVAAARALADLRLPIVLGHNRVQEARAASEALHRVPGCDVHLIGNLQANKVNQALRCVDCVETIDTVAIAERLDARARAPLPVLVEVNVSGETAKHGCAPREARDLAGLVASLAHLQLRGFMTVGAHVADERSVRQGFARLRRLRDAVLASGDAGTDHARELSMGMSGDFPWAIAEGATIVRIGTAVFGRRPPM